MSALNAHTALPLIVRPSRAGGNMRDHLRLGNDKLTYNKIRDEIRCLIQWYLTRHRTFRSEVGQPTVVWRAFETDAVTFYDRFRLYEGLWIIEYLVQDILRNHFGDEEEAEQPVQNAVSEVCWRWDAFGVGKADVNLQEMQRISEACQQCPRTIQPFAALITGTLMRVAVELADTFVGVPSDETCATNQARISLGVIALRTLLKVFDAVGDIHPPYAAACQLFNHFRGKRPSDCLIRLLVVEVYLRLAQVPSMNPACRMSLVADCITICEAACHPSQFRDRILLTVGTLECQLGEGHVVCVSALRALANKLAPSGPLLSGRLCCNAL